MNCDCPQGEYGRHVSGCHHPNWPLTWPNGRIEGSRERVKKIMRALEDRGAHLDNTGASCRIDWDGHDCCYTCNLVEAVLKAAAHELAGEDDE